MIILKAYRIIPFGTFPEKLDLRWLYSQPKAAITALYHAYFSENQDRINGPMFEIKEITVINPRKDQLTPGNWEIIYVDPIVKDSNIPGFTGRGPRDENLTLHITEETLEDWKGWFYGI